MDQRRRAADTWDSMAVVVASARSTADRYRVLGSGVAAVTAMACRQTRLCVSIRMNGVTTKSKAQTRELPHKLRIIGGAWRGRKLEFPANDAIRPTPDRVRETVFNWLQNDMLERGV